MFDRPHFVTHTHALAAHLNACERYLYAEILRPAHGADCTNNGVSSRYDAIFVPHSDGNFSLSELLERHTADHARIMEVIPPAFPGCPFRLKPRGLNRGMAGGNWCVGDSRFMEVYGAPISIHDRVE